MIYPGTDLKFRVSSAISGFDLAEHNFAVEILNQRGSVRQKISKEEMFCDADGAWYFTIENTKKGPLYAKFYAVIPDDDYDKLTRMVTDVQMLCVVGVCDCHISAVLNSSCCHGGHCVRYEQVWNVNLDDGAYLCDAEGNLIITKDGARIKVNV